MQTTTTKERRRVLLLAGYRCALPIGVTAWCQRPATQVHLGIAICDACLQSLAVTLTHSH